MNPNPRTPTSSRRRNQNQEDNPFFLNTPVEPHQSFDTPRNMSFTGMLQQSDYPHSPMPDQVFQQSPIQNPFATQFYPNPNPNAFQRFSRSQGFQQFHQSQSQQFHETQSQQFHQSQSPHSVTESIPETVPETQPEIEQEAAPSKRKHKKGKGKAKATGQQKTSSGRIQWTDDEEACLARGWMSISEDGMRGNAQSNDCFWERITAYFHHEMGKGEYRTSDMLCSKWRDLQRSCTAFNGIFNNFQRQWESGNGDFDVLNAAHKQYRDTINSNGFRHIKAWKVLHDGPKWVFQRDVLTSSGSNKRSRTSVSNDYTHYSDANTRPFDLNDETEEITRPDGRDKERGKAKRGGSSSRQSVSNRDEDLSYFKDVFSEHLKMKKETIEKHAMEKDLRMLSMNPEGLPSENREVIEKVQKTIRERLKNVFKF